jgi:hypothetical protein
MTRCIGSDEQGSPCEVILPTGWQCCVDHLMSWSAIPLEERVEALVQVVDGSVKGATIQQQLTALDLLGQLGGLDE